jgi:carboxymethylenebutenolidase
MAPLIDLDGIRLAEPLRAYRADPPGFGEGGEVRGGIVLIHEIWGLVDHIRTVADRFAAEGYVVIAPDILGPTGVSAEVGDELQRLVFSSDEQTRSDAQPVLREKLAPSNVPEYAVWAVTALQAAVDHLVVQPGVDDRVAVVGFCFGGSYSFALAGSDDRIRAAVPFYGHPLEPSCVTGISCPVLAFYGSEDERLMQSLPALTASMLDAGVPFTPDVWEGAGHAFFNDANSSTYDPDAAANAWARTLAFLRTSLR